MTRVEGCCIYIVLYFFFFFSFSLYITCFHTYSLLSFFLSPTLARFFYFVVVFFLFRFLPVEAKLSRFGAPIYVTSATYLLPIFHHILVFFSSFICLMYISTKSIRNNTKTYEKKKNQNRIQTPIMNHSLT
jgi:hypothetical protein